MPKTYCNFKNTDSETSLKRLYENFYVTRAQDSFPQLSISVGHFANKHGSGVVGTEKINRRNYTRDTDYIFWGFQYL